MYEFFMYEEYTNDRFQVSTIRNQDFLLAKELRGHARSRYKNWILNSMIQVEQLH